jgi:putative redox protein
MHVELKWNNNMNFTATGKSAHPVLMDAAPAVGGDNLGPLPKELLLKSLAGCTAMDVISILRKMQVLPDTFRIEINSEISEDHPKIFTKIHLKYIYSGSTPEDKMKRAVELSQDQYCSVSAMLKKAVPITYEIVKEG